MGKASSAKRRRREGNGPGGGRPPGAPGPRSIPVFWITIVAVVLAAIAAVFVTRPDAGERAAAERAAKVPAFASVDVQGDALPTWTGAADDPAVGMPVPTISARTFAGDRTTIEPHPGTPRVIVTLAHGCPHCRAEVPRIVDWARDRGASSDVEVFAVSTAVSESRENYPPAAWLERERWPFATLIDDEVGSAAVALGAEGFPFITFVRRDGTIAERFSGEMPMDEFAAAIERIETAPRGARAPARD